MAHALVTIVAPLAPDRVAQAEAAVDALGNPARLDIRAALDRRDGENGTHFASLHALRSYDGRRAYIVLEFSADGSEDEALARIERQIGSELRPVFMQASNWREGGELLAYLRRHRVVPGNGWFGSPGQCFAGTPGLTVGRILREGEIAAHVTALLASQPAGLSALARVEEVRRRLQSDGAFADALRPGAPMPPFEQPGLPS